MRFAHPDDDVDQFWRLEVTDDAPSAGLGRRREWSVACRQLLPIFTKQPLMANLNESQQELMILYGAL